MRPTFGNPDDDDAALYPIAHREHCSCDLGEQESRGPGPRALELDPIYFMGEREVFGKFSVSQRSPFSSRQVADG
jgi:hypothetical protein